MTAETDPNGKAAHEHGSKLDAGKAPMWRGLFSYFPNALEAVSLVSQKGAEKYTWGGWKTVPDGVNRYTDALARHLKSEAAGETHDPDGLLHAAQVAWNALARLELIPRSNSTVAIMPERRFGERRVDYSYTMSTPARRRKGMAQGRRVTDLAGV